MKKRLLKPLLFENGNYHEIPFSEAFRFFYDNLKSSPENSTLVMSSGDYSNETLYLLQKLSRIALNTNALSALAYYNKGLDFFADKNDIIPFAELFQSDCFFCAFDKNSNAETLKTVFEILDKCPDTPKYWFNDSDFIPVSDYYDFFRAVNYYILDNHLEKGIYVQGLGKNYSEYKDKLLSENFDDLLSKINLKTSDIQNFTNLLLSKSAPAFVVWEPQFSQDAYHELENLCMLVDIQSKPSAGFLCIKPDINSQGLFDMGFFSKMAPGGETIESAKQIMAEIYQKPFCSKETDVYSGILDGGFQNVLIWNSSMKDIPDDVLKLVDNCKFSVLHSAYYPTYNHNFDIVLPANLPEEMPGIYTDSTKTPHNYTVSDNQLEYNNLQQISLLAEYFGLDFSDNRDEIFMEYISFMHSGCNSAKRHFFK